MSSLLEGWLVALLPLSLVLASCGGSSKTASSLDPSIVPTLLPLPTTPQLVSTSILPQLSLGVFQNQVSPNSISNDRSIKVGGIFSDLFRNSRDAANVYWAAADRGPNGQLSSPTRRTFPLPTYNPAILQIQATGGQIQVLRQIPILTASGQPVTGLSNLQTIDETPFNFDGTQTLPFNPNGLDIEGLVQTPDGNFWIAEEYSPSIALIGSDGRIRERWVPQGRGLVGTDYLVRDLLPAAFNNRRQNRGLESLTISPDGRTLFTAIQSPLSFPDRTTGDSSRIIRLLSVDTSGSNLSQFIYVMDPISPFTDGQETLQSDMKISGLVYVNPQTLLVLERTDFRAKIYLVSLNGATNVQSLPIGSSSSPSLESISPANLPTNNVTPVTKTLLLDTKTIDGTPNKVEGLTIIDATTLAYGNDNDFDVDTTRGIGGFDTSGNLIPSSPPSDCRLLVIRLSQALDLR